QEVALRDPLVGPERLVEVRQLELAVPTPNRVRALSRDVTCDVPGCLVITQPEVRGMAQVAVMRPFAETDLRDQLRLDPLHVAFADARHLRRLGERARVTMERLQQAQQLADLRVVEAGADVADVPQLAVLVG